MFAKIKVRSYILAFFENAGLETNPYKLHPLCNFIYYDQVNKWLPFLKKKGLDTEQIAAGIIIATLDVTDESTASHVNSISEQDLRDLLLSSALNTRVS